MAFANVPNAATGEHWDTPFRYLVRDVIEMKVYDKCTVPVMCLLFFFSFLLVTVYCGLFVLVELGERERELLFLYVCASQCVTVDFEEFAHASDQMSRDVASVFKLRPVVLL